MIKNLSQQNYKRTTETRKTKKMPDLIQKGLGMFYDPL